MILIALEGMHFTAQHGYYDEEQQLGTEFIVDVWIEAKTHEENDDNIQRTVNYETVYLLCRAEMNKPAKLIETVARRMLDSINKYFKEYKETHELFEGITGVKIRLRKMYPPLGGQVHSAYVEVGSGSFGWPKMRSLKKLKGMIDGWSDLSKKLDHL